MAEVKELAAQVKTLGINSLILDTEAFAPCLDLGCLPELSRIMGGIYHSLATIRAPEMVATHRGRVLIAFGQGQGHANQAPTLSHTSPPASLHHLPISSLIYLTFACLFLSILMEKISRKEVCPNNV